VRTSYTVTGGGVLHRKITSLVKTTSMTVSWMMRGDAGGDEGSRGVAERGLATYKDNDQHLHAHASE